MNKQYSKSWLAWMKAGLLQINKSKKVSAMGVLKLKCRETSHPQKRSKNVLGKRKSNATGEALKKTKDKNKQTKKRFSCNLYHSCCNTGYLTYFARPGMEPRPHQQPKPLQRQGQILNLLHLWGNSKIFYSLIVVVGTQVHTRLSKLSELCNFL